MSITMMDVGLFGYTPFMLSVFHSPSVGRHNEHQIGEEITLKCVNSR